MAATRVVIAEDGSNWEALAEETIVSHGKQGAVLSFRPAENQAGSTLRTTITFNSMPAADFALRTMSDKDLLRRLSLARMAAGGV
jgi:hypothetical protein